MLRQEWTCSSSRGRVFCYFRCHCVDTRPSTFRSLPVVSDLPINRRCSGTRSGMEPLMHLGLKLHSELAQRLTAASATQFSGARVLPIETLNLRNPARKALELARQTWLSRISRIAPKFREIVPQFYHQDELHPIRSQPRPIGKYHSGPGNAGHYVELAKGYL